MVEQVPDSEVISGPLRVPNKNNSETNVLSVLINIFNNYTTIIMVKSYK